MRHRLLILAGGLALAGMIAAAPADANVLIQIDKSTQQMTVSVDGQVRWQWPVSTGRPGRDTPSGTFHAFRMESDHFSKEFDDAPMPHSIFFTKIGHAVHGYLDTRNIGMPASHGCVRLEPANATALYALVEQQGVLNTTVVVSGDARIALARGRVPTATQASGAPETAPSYGYGYSDNRGYGYGDNRGYGYSDNRGYGYGDNRSSGYSDNRAYGYGDQRSYSSTDERYAPLQRRAPYDGQQQSQAYGDQQSGYPTPPPGYPPYPRPWR